MQGSFLTLTEHATNPTCPCPLHTQAVCALWCWVEERQTAGESAGADGHAWACVPASGMSLFHLLARGHLVLIQRPTHTCRRLFPLTDKRTLPAIPIGMRPATCRKKNNAIRDMDSHMALDRVQRVCMPQSLPQGTHCPPNATVIFVLLVLPPGGQYRLIDIPLSNLLNSSINKVCARKRCDH